MTNPFAIIVLHGIETYNKIVTSSPTRYEFPKGLFALSGATAATAAVVIATILYKTSGSTFLSRIFNRFTVVESQDKDASTDVTPYEDKYFKEYDEWLVTAGTSAAAAASASAPTNECLENMYYSTVRDTINDFYGEIIMCYDAATTSFAYYARSANIPYKYLETVSRKYMIETNAPREIHVDIRKEYAKAKTKGSSTIAPPPAPPPATSSATPPPQSNDTDVFAKFKSYNTAPNITNASNNTITQQNTTTTTGTTTTGTTTAGTTTDHNTKVIRENANRYSYRGKINDFDTHHKLFLAHRRRSTTVCPLLPIPPTPATTTTTDQPQNETYAEYKKRNQTTGQPRG
jgi:hypothetical protein